MTVVGASCANGSESHQLTVAELAAHHHRADIYDPGHTHTYNYFPAVGIATTDVTGYYTINNSPTGGTTGSSTTGVLVNGGANGNSNTYDAGSSTFHPIVQPTVGVNYIIRVL